MTQMPQLVALFNGVGGGAAALVALLELADTAGQQPARFTLAATAFTILVGSVSFAGSLVTFAKLQELMTSRPVVFPGLPVVFGAAFLGSVALAVMLVGARIFVLAIDGIARRFGVPQLVLSLLLAPFATELPEKFNSVLWAHRGKDTLALGNLTGAMVFQSAFPVTVGLLLTPWELTGDALVAAVVALLAGSVLYLTLRFRGRLTAPVLLIQGVFYVGYVGYVLTKL